MAIRPCQRGLPTVNSLQANALGEFAGISSIPQRCTQAKKMEIEKDEKYWKDYTEFINEVEKLTGISPSDLLLRYKTLIEELNDSDEDYYLEWQYEMANEFWTRQKIQNVIDHKSISKNILLKDFKEEIENLDSEIKKHILNFNKADWWNNPELKFKLN